MQYWLSTNSLYMYFWCYTKFSFLWRPKSPCPPAISVKWYRTSQRRNEGLIIVDPSRGGCPQNQVLDLSFHLLMENAFFFLLTILYLLAISRQLQKRHQDDPSGFFLFYLRHDYGSNFPCRTLALCLRLSGRSRWVDLICSYLKLATWHRSAKFSSAKGAS